MVPIQIICTLREVQRLTPERFEAHLFRKLSAILALFAIIVIPLCGACAGDRRPGFSRVTRGFRLGELLLTQSSINGDYLLKFSRDGKELVEAECAFKMRNPKTVGNTPLPHCRTLLAYCFSGGAHCCTTLFLATKCGLESSLDMADLGDTGSEVRLVRADGAPGKEIEICDWSFAFYGSEDLKIQFSFMDSPAMTRLLVFDKGHWRVDRPGEFSMFYSRLVREAVSKARIGIRRGRPELAASQAMKAAYYDIMSGAPSTEAAGILNRLFPARWLPETGNVIQDISSAVSGFKPVEAIR